MTIGRLHYDGGGDWYANPSSLPNLLAAMRRDGIARTDGEAAEKKAALAGEISELERTKAALEGDLGRLRRDYQGVVEAAQRLGR